MKDIIIREQDRKKCRIKKILKAYFDIRLYSKIQFYSLQTFTVQYTTHLLYGIFGSWRIQNTMFARKYIAMLTGVSDLDEKSVSRATKIRASPTQTLAHVVIYLTFLESFFKNSYTIESLVTYSLLLHLILCYCLFKHSNK